MDMSDLPMDTWPTNKGNWQQENNKPRKELDPLSKKINQVQRNLKSLNSTDDPEKKEVLLQKISKDCIVFETVLDSSGQNEKLDFAESCNDEFPGGLEEVVQSYTKRIASEKDESKQVELFGEMTANLIKEKETDRVESLLKDMNTVEKAIESALANLRHLRMLSPYTKSLSLLLPVLRNRCLEKIIKRYEGLVRQLEEAGKTNPQELNLQYAMAKSQLKLLKIEKIKHPVLSNYRRIASQHEFSLGTALEFLIPILPEGYESLKKLSVIPKEIKSILQVAQAERKIRERSQSLQLLRSMKKILNEKIEELRKNRSSSSRDEEEKIGQELRKIEGVERQILFEGMKRTKHVLELLEGFFQLSELFTSSSTIAELTNILGTLKTIPAFAVGAVKLAQSWTRIGKLEKQIELLNIQIDTLEKKVLEKKGDPEKSLLLQYLKWKEEALDKGAMSEEILDCVVGAYGMMPTAGKIVKEGAVLAGASKALIGTLGIPALASSITYFGVLGTKFILFQRGIIPKTWEDVNIHLEEKALLHELESFKTAATLFISQFFGDFDNRSTGTVSKSRKALLQQCKQTYESLLDERDDLLMSKIDLQEKYNADPNNAQIKKKLKTLFYSIALVNAKIECIMEIQKFLSKSFGEEIKNTQWAELKIKLMGKLTGNEIFNAYLQEQHEATKLRKEKNLKTYELQLKLDRAGISKNQYEERMQWLTKAIKDPALRKELFEYLERNDPQLAEKVLSAVKEGYNDKSLKKAAEFLMENILKKPEL